MRGNPAKPLVVLAAFLIGLGLSLWLGRLPTHVAGRAGEFGGQQPESVHRYARLACMSPAAVEITFALGAGDRVVGVSQHTKWPPEALDRPECGAFINPSFERILALRADLIITQGRAEDLTEFGDANGIDVISLALTDLESIFAETRRLGRLLEAEAEADLVCARMRAPLAKVAVRVQDLPPVRVLLVVGREPGALNDIYSVASGTFLHDLIELAGGVNLAADLPSRYAIISKEALIERAPEVIVELHGEGADEAARQEALKLWQGLPTVPAVRRGRVYVIEATYAMIPGPRVVQLAETLAELLHGGEAQ